tara:strand:+ start:33 stop:221 length:189 start_codon:yes stop_codon:yes gene_type:complete
MKVGDLVAYKYDATRVGLIIDSLPERGDDHLLVLWTREDQGKQQWCVSPAWIQLVKETNESR